VESLYTPLAAFLAVILLPPLYRVLRGPTVFDRLLGASVIGSKTIVISCLFGYAFGRIEMFLDIALGYAILNFVGAVAIEKYFSSEEVSR